MSKSQSYDNYIDWVRDAHAMEKQAESMLSRMADRLEHYLRLRDRINQHITETQDQQRLVQGVLDNLDTSRSVLKDAAGKMTAMGQALGDCLPVTKSSKVALVATCSNTLRLPATVL